jgi:metalloreductase STEAP4
MANANVDKRSSLRRKLLKLDTKVAVVGSGWIGRALAKRFWDASISVVIGSRNPSASEKSRFDVPCRVITVEEACQWADVIVLAVPCTTHTRLVPILETAAWDKVVIDCSNRSPNSKNTLSVAEELQQMLPNCKIVKAFNDTSAYELNKHSATSVSEKILRFCGDDETSKVMLRSLLERMGSSFRDVGSLKSARILEAIPYQFFDEWRSSLFIAAPCLLFVILYSPHWYSNSKENPYVFAKRFVSISGHFSLLLLSVVYLAGIVAALYQMVSGTATKSFPKWLSNWLAVRKHLGLIALWFAFYHVISSCFLNIPISMYDAGDSGTGRTLNR